LTIPPIAPLKARQKVRDGEALLVCAYDEDETRRDMRKDQGILFNCS